MRPGRESREGKLNAYLAGVNLFLSGGMLVLGLLFAARLRQNGLLDPLRKVFLAGMGAAYVLLALDYATTAILRIQEAAVVPNLADAPTGILLLAAFRTFMACFVWGTIAYTLYRNDRAGPPEGKTVDATNQKEKKKGSD